MDQNILSRADDIILTRDTSHPKCEFSLNHGEIADSLLAQGETALLKGDLNGGLEFFDSANKLSPSQPKLLYAQGLSLFEYGRQEGREKSLLLASKKFKAATLIAPHHFDAWQAWGSTLYHLGTTFKERHYFQEAKEKFERALFVGTQQSSDALAALHWDLALVHLHLAEYSEEAMDLHLAVDAFQKASSLEENLNSDFWRDFGEACLKFASHINDLRFYAKAIQCLKHAIILEADAQEAWELLAATMQKLYEHTHDEDHFIQANECYTTATGLQPENVELWLNWAKFLGEVGKRQGDIKRLRLSIEKCQRANTFDPENPMIQAIWAEGLAMLGDQTERLDLIFEAQNKITQAIEMNDSDPAIWYSYGVCMQACAHYFNDFDYYYQAIEKFQEGISLDRTCHRHWHAIGLTYSNLGRLDCDVDTLQLSLRFFQKALDLHPSTFYTFDYASALAKLGEMTHEQHWLESATAQFEKALQTQKNAIYQHPDWLFHYACALDSLGDFHEEHAYYLRAIEIFAHVLMIDPEFYLVHHRLALALTHLGELSSEPDYFYRAMHHFRLALKNDEENDSIILDWSIAMVNLSEYVYDSAEREQLYRDAEHKLTTAMRLGNLQTYYHLACLHSLIGNVDKAMRFLEKAESFDALPSIDEMLQDEWLDNLHSTGDFREFVSHLKR